MGNPLSSAYKFVFGEDKLDKAGDQRVSDRAVEEGTKKRRQGHEGDDSTSQYNTKEDRWIKDYDDKRQRSYYYNPARQEIVWKPPPPSRKSNSVSSKTQWLQQRLPPDSEWKVAYDRSQRKPYYYNPTTQESKWELSSSSSSSNKNTSSVVVAVEHQGQSGLVVLTSPPTESSSLSFSTLRSTIQQKHSMSDFYPKNLDEEKEEWMFQLKRPGQSSNIQIRFEQENDVQLFQSLMPQISNTVPVFELVVVEKKEEKNTESFEDRNSSGDFKDQQEMNNHDTEVDAVLVEKPVEMRTANSLDRQNHQTPSFSSTAASQPPAPPVLARMSTPQPTRQQIHNQAKHSSPSATTAMGTRSSRSTGTPNSGTTTNRPGTRNNIATVPTSTPPIPPLPPTNGPSKALTIRRSGVTPPLQHPQQQQQQRRNKPPTPPPVRPPQQQQQQNLMTTRRTRRSDSASSASSFNHQHQQLGVKKN